MRTTKKLYQWDTNQKLIDCVGKYVDFPIGDEVYRIEAIDKECIIPDELLQVSGTVKVYECMEYGTVKAFAFYINPRPMPPDYVFTPTQRLTFEGLVKKVDETIEDLQKRAASGEFNGIDYVITESDYDAIAAKTADKLQPTIGKLARTLETEKADREQADKDIQKDISGKLSEPVEGLEVGKYFRVAQIDENGHAVLEAVDAKTIGVQDVQVNGESIVNGENGVVDLPLATNTKLGLVTSAGSNYGIGISGGLASLNLAAQNEIDARTTRKVISPQNIDYAVKAAMCDGKGAEWTADEQAAARARAGMVTDTPFELVGDVTTEEAVQSIVLMLSKPCRYISITLEIPPESVGASRSVYFSATDKVVITECFHRSQNAKTSGTDRAIYKSTAEIVGGEIISYGGISVGTNMNIDYMYHPIYGVLAGYGGMKADSFTNICVFTYGTAFPAGSSVKIYGC